jgi:hypothetical protein
MRAKTTRLQFTAALRAVLGGGRLDSARGVRPSLWVLLLAGAFCGYFALLIYCDVMRPENPGFVLSASPERTVVVSDVFPGTPAAGIGLRTGDRIVAVNGVTLASIDSWGALGTYYDKDKPMAVVLERDGRLLELTMMLRSAPASYWSERAGVFLVLVRMAQLITLLSGLLIIWRRPRDPVALTAAWLLLTCAVFTIALPFRLARVWQALPVPVGALLWAAYASALGIGPVLLTFAASFPRYLAHRTSVLAATWAIAGMTLASPLHNFMDLVYGGHTLRSVGPGTRPLLVVTIVSLAAAFVIMAINFRRIEDLNERRRLRAVVVGIGTAVVPGFSLLVSHWTAREANMATWLFESPVLAVAAIALLAAPLSISYAVLRHRLFDVSFIIRRWLQYAVARWAVLSLAPLFVAVLVGDLLAHGHDPVNAVLRQRGTLYLNLVAAATAAYVLRHRWLDALDRRFFRERHHGYAVLRDVAEQIRRSSNIEGAAPLAVARIEAALHPEFVALLVRDEDGRRYRTVAAAPSGFAPDDLSSSSKLVALARVIEKPLDTSDDEGSVRRHLQARDLDFLQRTRVDLVVPVMTPDSELPAMLVLGRKRSDEPYAHEDYDLLVAIAENLALLIARSAPTPVSPVLEECPECGACFDGGTGICTHDGRDLQARDQPRTLAGRYRLLRRLETGGMGAVYEAQDNALDKVVAVKLVRDDLPPGWGGSDRLVEEARLAARLVHPNVVTMLDFGVVGKKRPFLVMERLVGRTLRQELEATGSLPPSLILAILRGVCSGIDAAHRLGLVHRDLKPENIFLVDGDSLPIPKILDFGIARPLTVNDAAARHRTGPGILAGTPEYMAPERLRGERVSPAWDIWSIGLMAFEMMTLNRPFTSPAGDGWNPGTQLRPAQPHCALFFQRSLAINPVLRPVDGRALYAGLEQAFRADGLVN